ncbi:MAG: uS9 family ribosomal protein [Patescibacteria group bacterium]
MSTQIKYHYGVGRRKASTARAKYFPTEEDVTVLVNKKELSRYFPYFYEQTVLNSLSNIGIRTGKIELYINGGGIMGQSEAARLAIAKAILKFDEGFRPILRTFGYITTDIRKVLPKRPGLRKARKREQWSKR